MGPEGCGMCEQQQLNQIMFNTHQIALPISPLFDYFLIFRAATSLFPVRVESVYMLKKLPERQKHCEREKAFGTWGMLGRDGL